MSSQIQNLLDGGDSRVEQYRPILLSLARTMDELQTVNSEAQLAWEDHNNLMAAASGGTLNEYIAGYAERHRQYMAEWSKAPQHNGTSDASQLGENEISELEAGNEKGVGG